MGIVEEAHRYADAGLYVIPIQEMGKRPAIRTGPEHRTAATLSHNVIDAWWTAHPEWNVAIVCSPSRIVVVDIDGDEGEATLADLVRFYGPPPPTWEARTGNGRHLVYRWPTKWPVRTTTAGNKLDIRGAGSYIVAPPSIHPTGRMYEWVRTDCPIADAPLWLVAAYSDPSTVRATHVTVNREFVVGPSQEMWKDLRQRLTAAGLDGTAAWVDEICNQ